MTQQQLLDFAGNRPVPSPRSFVTVPRAAIEQKLQRAGFTREPVHGEVVYSLQHRKHPGIVVKVFTSVPEFDVASRPCSEDAIRVVALLTWQRREELIPRHKRLFKARVNRTGTVEGVLERTLERAREAYRACNKFVRLEARR